MTLNGVACREWEGITDRAVKVTVFVAAVRVEDDGVSCEEFAAELVEVSEPAISERQQFEAPS